MAKRARPAEVRGAHSLAKPHKKQMRGLGAVAPPLAEGEIFNYLETRPSDEDVGAWGRPAVTKEKWQAIDSKGKPFIFQLVDCQAAYVSPKQQRRSQPPIMWNGDSQVPVIRLYGVTPEGHSVCVNVWNFAPYLFLNTPNNLPANQIDLEVLEHELDVIIKKHKKPWGGGGGGANRYQHSMDDAVDDMSALADDYNSMMMPRGADRARFYAEQRAVDQGMDPMAVEREYEIRSQMLESIRNSGGGSLWGGSASGSGGEVLLPHDKIAANRSSLVHEDPPRRQNQCVVSIAAVGYRVAHHYDPMPRSLLRVNLRTPNLITVLRDLVTAPRDSAPGSPSGTIDTSQGTIEGPSYESSVLYETRFLVDHGISGSGYACIKGPFWKRRRYEEDKETTCQIEIDADFNEVMGLPLDSNLELYSQPSKIRIFSRDIEVDSTTGDFPTADKDPVIIIHGTLYELDQMESPLLRIGFCLGSLPKGKERLGERVICYDNEKEMLDAYGAFVILSDPDILTGYNSKGFDAPYLFDRATLLGATAYLMSSRLCSKQMIKKTKMRQSKNLGNRESFLCLSEGRVEIDVMQYIQDAPNYKLRSYSLNAVSAEFLNDQKDDVNHKMIPILYHGSASDRQRLVDYCRKDADLPRRLMIRLKIMLNIVELCRVQGVQIKDQQDGNPTGRAFACFLPVFRANGFVVPYNPNQQKHDYAGASVFEPQRGFYKDPVVILDFASLYPSEMMAHNLCYTTFIPKNKVAQVAKLLGGMDKIEICPDGHAYVRSSVQKGVLPIVLARLINARAAVKKLLETEKDPRIRSTLTTREMAIKIVANSVYGFCGLYSNGTLWQEVAESTTAYGREQIKETRRIVETVFVSNKEKITVPEKTGIFAAAAVAVAAASADKTPTRVSPEEKLNSPERLKLLAHVPLEKRDQYLSPRDAEVLYGDTDSVMIRFGIPVDNWDSMDEVSYAVGEAQRLGALAAELCTRAFAAPNKLQLECIIMPFLLINKKRYGGLIWSNPNQWSSMKLKGIESVRRDNCRHVARTQTQALKILFEKMDPSAAIKYAADAIGKVRRNQVDLYDLIISGSLSKTEYKNPQAHAFVANLIKQRSPGSEPHIGDRVPYVIIAKDRNAKRYQKAEDPVYALENDLNIDTEYYVENQMMGPLRRIFEPIYGEAETNRLLRGEGDHVRIIKLGEEKTGLLKFYTQRKDCHRCGTALRANDNQKGLLCVDCEPHRLEEVFTCTKQLRTVEMEHSRLWTTCSTCQGTVMREVKCSNTDCPIFFKRTTCARELALTQKRMAGLSLDW